MKSLNFHVCHILPPYGKACPHVLKPLSKCPTMWLPTPGEFTVYNPKLPKLPISYWAQAIIYNCTCNQPIM